MCVFFEGFVHITQDNTHFISGLNDVQGRKYSKYELFNVIGAQRWKTHIDKSKATWKYIDLFFSIVITNRYQNPTPSNAYEKKPK